MRVFVCVHDKQFIYKEIIFSSVNPLKLNFTKRNEHSRRFIAVASFLFFSLSLSLSLSNVTLQFGNIISDIAIVINLIFRLLFV